MNLLDKLNLPQDLKKLSLTELEALAKEIRSKIIEITSEKGGHLSSNLGTVELCIALHAVFDSPNDKIIWDVGHQSYAHKILTGRLPEFSTLRTYKGLSGFPRKEESPHDHFTVGHASTSISTALGIARARDLKGENFSVIAVMGDASLSGGLALEGINNTAHLKTNLIVVLNDNEMSISKTVGGIANYLTALRTSSWYKEAKERVERIIKKVPKIGIPLFYSAKKLKDRVKHFLVDYKVGVIFEELGFKYLGPIDGHNIPLLMSTFHFAKDFDGPLLIHIITKKGKGYTAAEENPTLFHSALPYNIESGLSKVGSKLTYTSVFEKTIAKLADQNKNLIGITAAMLDGTGFNGFAEKYPERLYDVGIAEEHAVTFAAGLSSEGFKPVVAIYSTFLQRAYDQIMHDVCLQNLGVVFCLDRAGIVGEDGPTHNGVFDFAYLRHIPNMVAMAPADENELQHMIYTAVYHKGPAAIRYPKGNGPGAELDSEFKRLEIGKGETIYKSKIPSARAQGEGKNQKSKILIIAIGSMVYPSVEAAKILATEGIGVSVINARFVKPLDKELIVKTVKDVNFVITVEEGVKMGGFGSAVLELLSEEKICKPVKCIGLPDEFIEHGKREQMLEIYGLTASGIAKTISDLIR